MIQNYRCINLKISINGEIGLSLGEVNQLDRPKKVNKDKVISKKVIGI